MPLTEEDDDDDETAPTVPVDASDSDSSGRFYGAASSAGGLYDCLVYS